MMQIKTSLRESFTQKIQHLMRKNYYLFGFGKSDGSIGWGWADSGNQAQHDKDMTSTIRNKEIPIS
jgi:hypothetical protein